MELELPSHPPSLRAAPQIVVAFLLSSMAVRTGILLVVGASAWWAGWNCRRVESNATDTEANESFGELMADFCQPWGAK